MANKQDVNGHGQDDGSGKPDNAVSSQLDRVKLREEIQKIEHLRQGTEDYGICFIDEEDQDEDDGDELERSEDERESADIDGGEIQTPADSLTHLIKELNAAGDANPKKKKKKKKKSGKKKAKVMNGQTGFEQNFQESVPGEDEFAGITNLGQRIELGCSKYRHSRRLDSEKMSILDNFLNWGGMRSGQNQFQGNRQSQLEERDGTEDLPPQIDVLSFNTDEDTHMVFDIDSVVQSYLSQYILSVETIESRNQVLAAQVVSNFLNYFKVRKVFLEEEQQASLEAAIRSAKLAENLLPLVREFHTALQHDRYALATLIVAGQIHPYQETSWRGRSEDDMTMAEAKTKFKCLTGGLATSVKIIKQEYSVRTLDKISHTTIHNGEPCCKLHLHYHDLERFSEPLPNYVQLPDGSRQFGDDKLFVPEIEVLCDYALADRAQIGSYIDGLFLQLQYIDKGGALETMWTVMSEQARVLPSYYVELEVTDAEDVRDEVFRQQLSKAQMNRLGSQDVIANYVDRACDPSQFEPNLAIALELADYINSKKANTAREAAVEIVKMINHRNLHVGMLALSVLDVLSKNCGYPFHLQLATKDFLNELVKKFPERPPPMANMVMARILEMIHEWRSTLCVNSKYREDLVHIRDMHRLLAYKGYRFPDSNKRTFSVLSTNEALKTPEELEEEDRAAQAAKLQELIRRGTPKDLAAANDLMKIMTGFDQSRRPDYKTQTKNDLERVQGRAILLNDMLDNTKSGERLVDGDAYDQTAQSILHVQPKLQQWIGQASENDLESVDRLLLINDLINVVLKRYNAFKQGDHAAVAEIHPSFSSLSKSTPAAIRKQVDLINFDEELQISEPVEMAPVPPRQEAPPIPGLGGLPSDLFSSGSSSGINQLAPMESTKSISGQQRVPLDLNALYRQTAASSLNPTSVPEINTNFAGNESFGAISLGDSPMKPSRSLSQAGQASLPVLSSSSIPPTNPARPSASNSKSTSDPFADLLKL